MANCCLFEQAPSAAEKTRRRWSDDQLGTHPMMNFTDIAMHETNYCSHCISGKTPIEDIVETMKEFVLWGCSHPRDKDGGVSGGDVGVNGVFSALRPDEEAEIRRAVEAAKVFGTRDAEHMMSALVGIRAAEELSGRWYNGRAGRSL
ncbi:uncharacterized protein THITE_2091261 [Thermothielavioides terrestris NRRL 8126]|uniref:Uncharacterized protein n=1 Tax=Thermothielavioides terrestris (strain ATCC 38088 / NRRL 8126) TaxID=578455 RepID=G2RAS8_THETT|nr:uncharacterized protein THITE_2091261 [Thermothielavioides terrestris NRRL 8126]AEO69759.1 hypothetical protein THITE_2091261 [Thermothielavioides terrestris NRRL 8126]